MKNAINKVLIILSVCTFATSAFSGESNLEMARKNLAKIFPNIKAQNITKSPIPGIYQIAMPPRFYYASEDGRYIFNGDLIDVTENKNISQTARNKSVAEAINAMGEDSMIIFGNNTLKHTITVFTDIDCGYCRKLHKEVTKYNKLGIRVRYMSYPRAAVGSTSFQKAEAVWCSKDKAKALTDAKNGIEIKSKKCKNPVAEHYDMGNKIGIRGTPAIILEDGTLVPGYVPASRLIEMLNQVK